MLGTLIRLALFAAALIGAAMLFVYAAVLAIIFIPVVLILLWVLRKKGLVKWTTVDLRNAQYQQQPHPRPTPGRPTVIDHDPNDVTLDRTP